MTAPSSREHDPVVARALRDLPVPDHAPGFWERLEQSVAGAPAADRAGVAGGAPAEGRVDTGELPSVRSLAHERQGRRSRAPWVAVAAALLVLAGAVGAVLLAGDGGGDADLANEGSSSQDAADETTAATDTTGIDASTTAAVPATEVAAGAPDEVVQQWIEALGEGDSAAAAALLGPRTIAYIEALGSDPVAYMQESQEGYGAWAGSPDAQVTAGETIAVDLLGPGARLVVVTIAGTYPGEGAGQYRVDAIPVVADQGDWRIEHLAHAPDRENRLVFTVPNMAEDGTLGGMNPADDVNVFVPAEGTVFFRIDDGEVFADATSMVGRAPEPFALYNPTDDLASGTHQLVVVAVGADGTITSFGGTFLVEG